MNGGYLSYNEAIWWNLGISEKMMKSQPWLWNFKDDTSQDSEEKIRKENFK
jgi:hypothetical protein